MKPIPNGVDRVVHMNAQKLDRYTAKISSKPAKFHDASLAPDATNCIDGTGWRTKPKRPGAGYRTVSRNQ